MYLSKISIQNFKGIENLDLDFNPKINIIIGENGCCKSALIDAIRLLYNLGEPIREIHVSKDDFFEKIDQVDGTPKLIKSKQISITYEYRDLSTIQKGAFYEYMVINRDAPDDDYARINIKYEDKGGKYPQFSYSTGLIEGQRADYRTFDLFQHYYLGALRDSTKDLLSTRGNILGKVIKRHIDRKESQSEIERIIKDANDELLKREEVINTRNGVNENLAEIFKNYVNNKIGLEIEQSKSEYIVNLIKPFLPHDKTSLKDEGFNLWQNSLGYNNLIYIATVLGDINEQIIDDKISHYALLIEEPESHLHPQLQLNLYNFLKNANSSKNSQLFITTHSPTLTSKVPLRNLILLDNKIAFRLSNIFLQREEDKIIEDTVKNSILTNVDFKFRRKKLERYIDVTKSQLFYSKAILFVEGISEELIISALAKFMELDLEDYRIELVNVRGTSFYPFIYLFNSENPKKKIPKLVSILTDDDKYPESKDSYYSFKELTKDNYAKLEELANNINKSISTTRIANLQSVIKNSANILLCTAKKTLEYELVLSNIYEDRKKFLENFLIQFIHQTDEKKIETIIKYLDYLNHEKFTRDEREKIALLVWKVLPGKAEFAQDFAIHLLQNLKKAKDNFIVPGYIRLGIEHICKIHGI
jgi:putative ATP-dependent endonuclease of OLD family